MAFGHVGATAQNTGRRGTLVTLKPLRFRQFINGYYSSRYLTKAVVSCGKTEQYIDQFDERVNGILRT